VLCHRRTAASVRLVEIDPRTAELADRVRVRLERRGVVAPGALEVVTADAGEADLGATDVVIVASLVPRPVVDRIVGRLVERLGAEGERTRWPVLVVRSASGLVARFAYDAVDPATVGLGVYRHAGTVAPIGREPDEGPPLLARAHRSVLNTSEFFVPVAGRGPART
jgi:hypothetical protein